MNLVDAAAPQPVSWQAPLGRRVLVCLALEVVAVWAWPPWSAGDGPFTVAGNAVPYVGLFVAAAVVLLFLPPYVAGDQHGIEFGLRHVRPTRLPWDQVQRIDDDLRLRGGRALFIQPVFGEPTPIRGTGYLLFSLRRDRARSLAHALSAWIPVDHAAAVRGRVAQTRA
jgi:hypothetical protein